MSAVLIGAGTLGLLVIVGHLLWQLLAWSKLDEPARAEQRQIKAADKTLHAADRGRRKRLKAAEAAISRANTTPVRARYGGLALHDDHVQSGGREYPLSTKTKAKVVGHGRGDQRKVMVLLEDTTWSSSLSATKVGKPNELEAQRFVAETRVRGANAVAARAARAATVEQAQAGLRREQANTTDLTAAQAARAALGPRHRGAGPSPAQPWRRIAAVVAVLALVVGGATAPPQNPGTDTVADAAPAPQEASPAATATPTPTPSIAALRARARKRVAVGDYAGAVRAVQRLRSADRAYVSRLIGSRAARIAKAALARGDRAAAYHAIRAANVMTPTAALRAAKASYDQAVAQASAARKARRLAAAQRATARKAAARAAAEAAASEASASDSSSGSSDGSQYAGQNCTEIGHSFTVTPGSDPEHDANNDGVACESFR